MRVPYYKISHWVFYLLMAISAVVFVLFAFVGFDNQIMLPNAAAPITDPEFTDLLIYWMYALVALCILCTLVAAFYQFVKGLQDNPKKTLKSLFGVLLLLILVLISWSLADATPVTLGGGELEETKWVLVLTDTALYTQYVLVVVAVLMAVVGLLGIFKNSNKIKA